MPDAQCRYRRIASIYDVLELPSLTCLWEPSVKWAYGASFDRDIEGLLPATGLEPVEGRHVADELVFPP